MARRKTLEIARKVAQAVVLIETLPPPVEERDRVALEKARDLVREADRDLAQADEVDSGKLAEWVAALGVIVLEWVLKRNSP